MRRLATLLVLGASICACTPDLKVTGFTERIVGETVTIELREGDRFSEIAELVDAAGQRFSAAELQLSVSSDGRELSFTIPADTASGTAQLRVRKGAGSAPQPDASVADTGIGTDASAVDIGVPDAAIDAALPDAGVDAPTTVGIGEGDDIYEVQISVSRVAVGVAAGSLSLIPMPNSMLARSAICFSTDRSKTNTDLCEEGGGGSPLPPATLVSLAADNTMAILQGNSLTFSRPGRVITLLAGTNVVGNPIAIAALPGQRAQVLTDTAIQHWRVKDGAPNQQTATDLVGLVSQAQPGFVIEKTTAIAASQAGTATMVLVKGRQNTGPLRDCVVRVKLNPVIVEAPFCIGDDEGQTLARHIAVNDAGDVALVPTRQSIVFVQYHENPPVPREEPWPTATPQIDGGVADMMPPDAGVDMSSDMPVSDVMPDTTVDTTVDSTVDTGLPDSASDTSASDASAPDQSIADAMVDSIPTVDVVTDTTVDSGIPVSEFDPAGATYTQVIDRDGFSRDVYAVARRNGDVHWFGGPAGSICANTGAVPCIACAEKPVPNQDASMPVPCIMQTRFTDIGTIEGISFGDNNNLWIFGTNDVRRFPITATNEDLVQAAANRISVDKPANASQLNVQR